MDFSSRAGSNDQKLDRSARGEEGSRRHDIGTRGKRRELTDLMQQPRQQRLGPNPRPTRSSESPPPSPPSPLRARNKDNRPVLHPIKPIFQPTELAEDGSDAMEVNLNPNDPPTVEGWFRDRAQENGTLPRRQIYESVVEPEFFYPCPSFQRQLLIRFIQRNPDPRMADSGFE